MTHRRPLAAAHHKRYRIAVEPAQQKRRSDAAHNPAVPELNIRVLDRDDAGV
jgi:hypothetical protein